MQCTHDPDQEGGTRCPVTRHCHEMKAVWNHILGDNCHDNHCRVKHCVSSRYVMNHYLRKQGCAATAAATSSSPSASVSSSSNKKQPSHRRDSA